MHGRGRRVRAEEEEPRAEDDPRSRQWRALLTGEDPSLLTVRRFLHRIPSSPRCKVCASPFHGLGGAVGKVFWHGPMRDNPLLCKACFGQLAKFPGGADLEISVVFADVRGSTGLAERISSGRYRALLQDYYHLAGDAIDKNGGIIDKFLGDGVMALFIPVIAGENHAARAIEAGLAVLEAVEGSGLGDNGVLVGAGVHSGDAFVGVIGSAEKTDFTALGDSVNIAARLGGLAGPGELLVSRTAWDRAGRGVPAEEREVEIAGRTGSLAVVALGHVTVAV
jgi:adenylate cyclase